MISFFFFQSVRHILDRANFPINNEGYYESLDSVTEQAKRLGEGMTGIARHAKNQDTQSLCESVHIAADAICGLAEGATQVHSLFLACISYNLYLSYNFSNLQFFI